MGGGKYRIDFYVGPNSMALPGKYRCWIGVSRRDKLLKKAKNPALRNAIDKLYRPGSFIGDGGTASVLKFEKRTGEHVSKNPKGHYMKAVGFRNHLYNKILKADLNQTDRKLARRMLNKLNKAILEWEDKL